LRPFLIEIIHEKKAKKESLWVAYTTSIIRRAMTRSSHDATKVVERKFGCGAIFDGGWCQGFWSKEESTVGIGICFGAGTQ
jgi:hypothetical protein